MFSFSFLLELNWILQQTHESHFAASSIVKKSLLPHVLKKKEKFKKWGFRVFTSPFNRTVVAQKLFRTDTLSPGGFEMDKSLKLQMIRPLPCWRQHLTLHMKTALFHCLWVTYTFHSIIRCNKNILVQKDESFLSFNKPTGPDRERPRERGLVGGGGGGYVWECDRTVLANKSSGLHHSLSPRRSFVLKLLSPSFPNLAQGCWWLMIRASLYLISAIVQSHSIIFQCACVSKTCWICFPLFES